MRYMLHNSILDYMLYNSTKDKILFYTDFRNDEQAAASKIRAS